SRASKRICPHQRVAVIFAQSLLCIPKPLINLEESSIAYLEYPQLYPRASGTAAAGRCTVRLLNAQFRRDLGADSHGVVGPKRPPQRVRRTRQDDVRPCKKQRD